MNKNLFKAAIVAAGKNQQDCAKHLGMSVSSFYRHFKKEDFGLDDCNKLIDFLAISNPAEVFFNSKMS